LSDPDFIYKVKMSKLIKRKASEAGEKIGEWGDDLDIEPGVPAFQKKGYRNRKPQNNTTLDHRSMPSGRYKNPTGPGDYDLP